jgi:hypothetical protein
MSPLLFDADRGVTEIGRKARTDVTIADLFGDPLTRALYREAQYAVPDNQRETCPTHLDWARNCLTVHVKAAA